LEKHALKERVIRLAWNFFRSIGEDNASRAHRMDRRIGHHRTTIRTAGPIVPFGVHVPFGAKRRAAIGTLGELTGSIRENGIIVEA